MKYILTLLAILGTIFICSLPLSVKAQKPAKTGKYRTKEVIVCHIADRQDARRVKFEAKDEGGAMCHLKYRGSNASKIALGGKIEIRERKGRNYKKWNVARITPILD